jgi:copper resistance protein B
MKRLLVALTPLILAASPVAAQDGHAGHGQPATPPPDPHAAHRTAAPQEPDPHAGHDLGSPPADDPHAGHDMSGSTPPDVETSADNPGRPAEAPPPAEALSGPAHAADAIFGAEVMAGAREQLRQESGAMRTTAVILERLEAGWGDGEETFLWDAQGWIGGDINRFWWKSEGEGDFGEGLEEAEVQALYSRAVLPFWDVQVGVRQDFRDEGGDATHLAAGIQGLAPYWWEIDAAVFLSTDGDLTARIEGEWDLRLTQRLIAQPRFELEASATDAPERGLASGLSAIEAGVRIRYEVRREFAPYIGVEWHSALGDTADLVRAGGGSPDDTRIIIGLRAWY